MKKNFLLVTFVLMTIVASAQYGYRDGNRIGITLGITQMSLATNNFKTKPELGWVGGMAVRGNYYDNFSMIFGMQFTESSFSVATKTKTFLKNEDVKYTLSGAQIRLILSYNIIKDRVSIDLGPILQVNGKLRIDAKSENNIVLDNSGKPTTLIAKDIIDVTTINGNLYAGISAGNRRVRAIICYQCGMNNMLNHLNKDPELITKNNGNSFKGHLGILSGQILFNL
ncbi:PorT family protein [Flavobacterium psychrotolerans]|uniref:Outer membrane protein beta-barrel domain-containing protein n=1 Tax=Flavobacterium psychrotolerans TaxID=2169410 RepID=A0A2U1JPN0_9FLAO|nr:PorT family protein [Flavobacterium psychrotolerans]PWA06934.1 hypothetical protein DB895_02845 [Flavobacterium psychrotolerans]